MKIWQELTAFCKDSQNLFLQPNFSVYGKNLVVIQGFKRVVCINNDKIVFDFANDFLTVVGQNLVIKKVLQGFAVVQGQIIQVLF